MEHEKEMVRRNSKVLKQDDGFEFKLINLCRASFNIEKFILNKYREVIVVLEPENTVVDVNAFNKDAEDFLNKIYDHQKCSKSTIDETGLDIGAYVTSRINKPKRIDASNHPFLVTIRKMVQYASTADVPTYFLVEKPIWDFAKHTCGIWNPEYAIFAYVNHSYPNDDPLYNTICIGWDTVRNVPLIDATKSLSKFGEDNWGILLS